MMLRCFSIKITKYLFNLFVSMGFVRGLFESDKHRPIFFRSVVKVQVAISGNTEVVPIFHP